VKNDLSAIVQKILHIKAFRRHLEKETIFGTQAQNKYFTELQHDTVGKFITLRTASTVLEHTILNSPIS
jgi:hypothetical protein